MNIDIEKLNRKTPYPEPSDEFFKTLQDNVIAKTAGEKQLIKKDAKVFALNFKWAAAAAVVLIAGITAFFGLNDSPELQMAQQKPIVDSTYEILQPASAIAENTDISPSLPNEENTKKVKPHHSVKNLTESQNQKNNSFDNTDRQSFADNKRKSENEVEKVLAAFTPDQLKDLDRNSEQDVYLDLYN